MTTLENNLTHPKKKTLNTLNKNLTSPKFWSIEGQIKKNCKKCYIHNIFTTFLHYCYRWTKK